MRTILERHWRAWKEGNEDGFTLIELLVVLLILGILLGIAIPTFLAVTHSAGTATAESNLETALTAADSYYESNGTSYLNLMGCGNSCTGGNAVSDLSQQGSNLDYTSGPSTTESDISVAWSAGGTTTTNGQVLGLAALNTNGNNRCYVIIDVHENMDPQTTIGLGGGTTTVALSGLTSNTSTLASGTYYGWYTITSSVTSCDPVTALGSNAVPLSGAAGAWTTGKFPTG